MEIPVPAPQEPAASACRALHAVLPYVLDGHSRRDAVPASPYTSAWADPAIVLRCGVSVPPALRPTSQLLAVNGVDWLPVEGERAWTFTTTGRVAHIEVVVPKEYDPAVNPLVDLAEPIRRAVPSTGQPPR